MTKIAILAACVALLACVSAQVDDTPDGINGVASVEPLIAYGQVAGIGQFEYAVKLFMGQGGSRMTCTGSLISSKAVLTAAHCMYDEDGKPVEQFDVLIGNVNYEKATHYSVKRHFIGPYNKRTMFGDIAILELNQTVPQTPIPLAPATLNTENLTTGTVMGWGLMEDNQLPTLLRYVKVPYIPKAECIELTNEYSTTPPPPDHICFGPNTGSAVGSCPGDSGGPTITNTFTNPMQIAITSYGPGTYKCGDTENVIDIDTSVAYWRNWIDDILILYNLDGQSRKNKLVMGRCMEGDTSRTLSSSTAGACCNECRGKSECKAWTWSRKTQECLLKSSKGVQTISPICTSGYF